MGQMTGQEEKEITVLRKLVPFNRDASDERNGQLSEQVSADLRLVWEPSSSRPIVSHCHTQSSLESQVHGHVLHYWN